MKMALIQITRRDGSTVLINPNDLKMVVVRRGASNSINVTFVTSSVEITIAGSQYMLDSKLRPAIKQRYNIVDVQSGSPIRRSQDGHPHDVIVVHSPRNETSLTTTLVFPRGLNSVMLGNNGVVTVNAYGGKNLTIEGVRRIKGDHKLFEAVPTTPVVDED